MNSKEVPHGYCHCGCNQLAPLAHQSNSKKGWVRGEPVRFLPGHHHNVRGAQPWEERFLLKVDKSAGPNACWPWIGTVQGGYGKFTKKHGQEMYTAHRLAYELAFGPIPEGKYVCRTCDNSTCCNPAHFQLRTVQENNTGKTREIESIAARFWSKVDKSSPDDCWLWTAHLDHSGYGGFGFSYEGMGTRLHHAHRVSWWLTTGQWPGDMFVCHTCDNPKCVNPSHLFLGTNQDNVDDMVQKQRQSRGEAKSMAVKARIPRGERHHNAKLTAEKVIEIRTRYANGGISMGGLRRDYDVSQATIRNIINRKGWTHI